MVRLVMILLGVDYLRSRWRSVMTLGLLSIALGAVIFTDALDGSLYFPIIPFALMMLLEGLATLTVAWTGMGGQRKLRYVKGATFCLSALLVLFGGEHGNFVLSLIFGTLFLVDGALQIVAARVVRYRRWRLATAGGVLEIAIAIFFYQPYPDHYAGTVAYCVAFGLFFGGWNMILLAARVRRMAANPAVEGAANAAVQEETKPAESPFAGAVWDGPPGPNEAALTVHVWTPLGTAKSQPRRQLIVDRYIAAVDRNGTISTGHAALETPEGVYISLYPAVEIDRSPNDFARTLRATRDNDVPGFFQPDYATESQAWCPSTQQVRIRNYDPARLQRFWENYRRDTTYNLTYRNCSSSVARALEAAIEGASARAWGKGDGWKPLVRIMTTPELWVAAQVRKRAATMAWTPGLTLDYARALSMLADPRHSGWVKMARFAVATMYRSRQRWRAEEHAAAQARETESVAAERHPG
ncbi:membrane protein [Caballeronia catudaia]|uniref:Membrane protein n=1 Tax=Caballeronia catudaia TaxID=1777136 RepID=A0A158BNJ9_9BURK|nr:hypothetical protein [Caballeronia catudaia]SAK71635.1 membrane protein [Caballeronia catudaia]